MEAKHGWDDVLTTVFCDTISRFEIVPSFKNFQKKKNYNKLMRMRAPVFLPAHS